jgi:hypothetical protein
VGAAPCYLLVRFRAEIVGNTRKQASPPASRQRAQNKGAGDCSTAVWQWGLVVGLEFGSNTAVFFRTPGPSRGQRNQAPGGAGSRQGPKQRKKVCISSTAIGYWNIEYWMVWAVGRQQQPAMGPGGGWPGGRRRARMAPAPLPSSSSLLPLSPSPCLR